MKTTVTTVVAITVAGLLCMLGTAVGQAPAPGPAPDANAANVKKTWSVLGFGLDKTVAVDGALKKATEQVRDYLRTQEPSFEWKPSPEFVKKHLLKQGGPERLAQHDYTVQEKGKDVTWQCWGLTVEITYADYEAMRRENDQLVASQKQAERERQLVQRQAERMSLLGRLTALLIVGCLLTLAYLRLEDKTKGHCSRLLLGGAVTAAVLTGAALLLI